MLQNTVIPLGKNMSEVDVALEILRQNGRPMYYRDLIEGVFELKPYSGDRFLAIAAAHTQINLDTRFVYFGHGQWGLKDWIPVKGQKKTANFGMLSDGETNHYYVEDDEHDGHGSWDE